MSKQRYVAYRNYKFHLKWNGRTIAAFSKARALTRKSGAQTRDPNRDGYEAITLERGVTHDPEFEQWANKIWDFASAAAGVSLRELRRDLIVELLDETGQPALTFNLFRCWVSEYQATPELDAGANAVVITSLRLENEGWERNPNSP